MIHIPDAYKPTADKEVAPGIYSSSIDGVYFIANTTTQDSRGFFSEILRTTELEEVIKQPFIIKQVNHSRSVENVTRGIHAEQWSKYITIGNGVCLSLIADVRPDSPTFGKKEYFVLGNADYALDGSVFLPPLAGNSMCVLEGPVDYFYFVDMLYKDRDTSYDVAISLFDPDLNIQWPIPREQMIISDRDTKAVTLREKYPTKF